MAKTGIDPEIFKQVAQALDPDDQIGLWEDQSAALSSIPGLRKVGAEMSDLVAGMRDLQSTASRSFDIFTERGWGITNVGVPVQKTALAAFDKEGGDAADAVIAESIDKAWLNRPVKRMKDVYRAREGEFHIGTVGAARWELARKAQMLHLEGHYDAAVPLILNAIEGLVADSETGKLFFTGNDQRMIGLLEPGTLVGMACSLKVLHSLYKTPVRETTTDCIMSRHGIMHGRVLGYGTKVASAKCWTLLDAVVEILIARQPRIENGR